MIIVDFIIERTDADLEAAKGAGLRLEDHALMNKPEDKFILEKKMNDVTGRAKWLQAVKRAIVCRAGNAALFPGLPTSHRISITWRNNTQTGSDVLSRDYVPRSNATRTDAACLGCRVAHVSSMALRGGRSCDRVLMNIRIWRSGPPNGGQQNNLQRQASRQ
jgi:hypothetical protein